MSDDNQILKCHVTPHYNGAGDECFIQFDQIVVFEMHNGAQGDVVTKEGRRYAIAYQGGIERLKQYFKQKLQ